MNIIQKLTFRHMMLNKKRTLVTILGVIISAAMICAVAIISYSFQDAMIQRKIMQDGRWHAVYHQVPAENITSLYEDEYTETAFLTHDYGYALPEYTPSEMTPYVYISGYDEQAMQDMPITLLSGRLPENKTEVVVFKAFVKEDGTSYEPGDEITLTPGIRYMQSGADRIYLDQETGYWGGDTIEDSENFELTQDPRTYTVTGVIDSTAFSVYMPRAGYPLITYLDLNDSAAEQNVDVRVFLHKTAKSYYDHAEMLAKETQAASVDFNMMLFALSSNSQDESFNTMISVTAVMLLLVIMIGSVFLIHNAFAISVSERSRYLGMLSSVGATRTQKMNSVLFEGFIIGCISIPFGILAGYIGMRITLHFINDLVDLGVPLRVVLHPWVIVITILVSLLTILISAYIPARKASKITPIEAIRQTQDVNIKKRTVRTSKLTRKLFGFEGTLALKNLKRYRGRYRTTLCSLVISLVLFLTASSYTYYLMQSYNMYAQYQSFDLSISPSTLEEADQYFDALTNFQNNTDPLDVTMVKHMTSFYMSPEFSDSIRTDDFKELVANDIGESFYNEYVDTEGAPLQILTMDENSLREYCRKISINADEFLNADKPAGIVVNTYNFAVSDISRAQLSPYKLSDHDTLPLYQKVYEADDYDAVTDMEYFYIDDLDVWTVTDQNPDFQDGSYYHPSYFLLTVIVNEAALEQLSGFSNTRMNNLFEEKGKDYLLQYPSANLYVSSENPQNLPDTLRQYLGDTVMDSLENSRQMYNFYVSNQTEKNVLTAIQVFAYGFILLITAICIANIFNTISTSIALRRREFAVIRSTGMTPGRFYRMILFESAFYGMKAILYGLPISILIMRSIHANLATIFTTRFTIGSLPWGSIAIGVLAIFLVTGSSMLYSYSKIRKENLVDALKNENI